VIALGLHSVRGIGNLKTGGGSTGAVFTARPIPDQTLTAGEAVNISLAAYFVYSGGSMLLSASPALPAGLALSGLALTGTPQAAAQAATFTLTATAIGGPLDGETRATTVRITIGPGNAAPLGADVALLFDLPAARTPLGADLALIFDLSAG